MRCYRLISTVLAGMVLSASSFGEDASITPYGDYCKDCTTYGTCKNPLPPKEAVKALEQYYAEKGYELGTVKHKGRFIEAVIQKDNKQVDKVLFDRNTGRLRSVY